MENRILFGAGLRRHKGSFAGVFVLLFLVSLTLGTVLTVWSNSGRYISSEMERAGFVHTAQAIRGFMLILQNAFSGLLVALVAVLLAAVLVVLSHSIGSTIEADYKSMGILKTVGFTSAALRRLQLLQYGVSILSGMVVGLLLTVPVSRFVSDVTLTTTGIRVPSRFPVLWCAGSFAVILFLLGAFILWKTGKI